MLAQLENVQSTADVAATKASLEASRTDAVAAEANLNTAKADLDAREGGIRARQAGLGPRRRPFQGGVDRQGRLRHSKKRPGKPPRPVWRKPRRAWRKPRRNWIPRSGTSHRPTPP